MLAQLNKNTLESLFRGLDALSINASEAAGDRNKLLTILQSHGVPSVLSEEILNSFEIGKFNLSILRSGTAFAISEKLSSYQTVCIVIAVVLSLATLASMLLSGNGFYVSFAGAVVIFAGGAIRFSREKRLFNGNRSDFITVEQKMPETRYQMSSPPDQY